MIPTELLRDVEIMTPQRTRSEILFEQFLSDHDLPFKPVPVAETPGQRRPDYSVGDGTLWGPLLFEIKELTEDENFGNGCFKKSSRKIGAHIRRKINESKKQIQFGAGQNIPSILLIYNALDPTFHLFGTECQDFQAAMNGDWTLIISRETGEIIDSGYGQNQEFKEDRNTSFTALGHLVPIEGVMSVRLFANEHAKISIPSTLPKCFIIK